MIWSFLFAGLSVISLMVCMAPKLGVRKRIEPLAWLSLSCSIYGMLLIALVSSALPVETSLRKALGVESWEWNKWLDSWVPLSSVSFALLAGGAILLASLRSGVKRTDD